MDRVWKLSRNVQKWKQEKEEEIRKWKTEKEAKRPSRCTVKIEHPRLLIKGKRYISYSLPSPMDSFEYFAFLGIPYATPPLGNLRFRPPLSFTVPETTAGSEPKKIKAYSSNHPCLQFVSTKNYHIRRKLIGSEDCLYLNVYIRERPENISLPLPVLVHIHGGGFENGSTESDQIKPEFILRNNVVFVTINYRLGVLGFLNMGTEECQGNAGLKDQVKALEWIQQNIREFGGDPNNVTISGHEAGATCVNLHMISPLSKNLFHKAIVQAGGIYSPWGFQKKPTYFEELCKKKYCTEPNMTSEAVVRTMKDRMAKDLLKDIEQMAETYIKQRSTRFVVLFGPSEEFREEGAFIPPRESIESLMKEAGHIPVIAGITEQEGYRYFHNRLAWRQNDFKKMLTDENLFVKFLQENLHWSQDSANRQKDVLKQIYFGASEIPATTDYQILQDHLATFLTDIWFYRFFDNFKIGEQLCAPLYVYQFDYIDRCRADYYTRKPGESEHENETLEIRGVRQKAPGHGDDMRYLYNPRSIKRLFFCNHSLGRFVVAESMSYLWADFCYTGAPKYGPFKWLPHTEETPYYLSIDETGSSIIGGRLGGERWTALKNILQLEQIVPSPEPSPTLKTVPLSANEPQAAFSSQRRFEYCILDSSSSSSPILKKAPLPANETQAAFSSHPRFKYCTLDSSSSSSSLSS